MVRNFIELHLSPTRQSTFARCEALAAHSLPGMPRRVYSSASFSEISLQSSEPSQVSLVHDTSLYSTTVHYHAKLTHYSAKRGYCYDKLLFSEYSAVTPPPDTHLPTPS